MTVSVHSLKTATTDHGKDHDPEVLVKIEVIDAPAGGDDDATLSPWEVTLEKSEDPKTMAVWHKWAIVSTISCGALCATSASSIVSATRHILSQSDLMRSYP